MSIRDTIDDELIRLCDDNRLFPLPLSTPYAQAARAAFLTAELNDVLRDPSLLEVEETRMARLMADLQDFAEGLDVAIPTFLKPLNNGHDGVWEFRRRKPSPSIRVFARFGRRDVLVLTHAVKRGQLGGRADPGWSAEIRRAKFIWRQLFATTLPITGGKISDYLSEPFHLNRNNQRRRLDAPLATLESF
jgi:hypothetical protein